MFDVVCVGSATQDVFIKSDLSKIVRVSDALSETQYLSYDYGAKVNIDHIEFLTGGGATNTATSFARMGLAVAAICKVGGSDDAGAKVVDQLEGEGVDTRWIARSGSHATGYSVILVSYEGDRTALTFRGANNTFDESDVDWSFLDETGWLYMSALSGSSAQMAHIIARRAGDAQVKLAFNPGSTQLKTRIRGLAPILQSTEILFINRQEAETLTGIDSEKHYVDERLCVMCGRCIEVCPEGVFREFSGRLEVRGLELCDRCGECLKGCPSEAILIEPWTYNMFEIFRALAKTGVKLAVVTDGNAGAQVCDGKNIYFVPSYSAPVVDTLGAGDAFASGFLAGYIRDGDVTKALELASANASSVVRYFGAKAGLLSRDEAADIIEEMRRENTHRVRKVPLGERVAT